MTKLAEQTTVLVASHSTKINLVGIKTPKQYNCKITMSSLILFLSAS